MIDGLGGVELVEGSFGKYELLGVIARGGMGVLYLAVQKGPGGFSKVVAVKRGLPHLSQNEEFRRSFLNEAQVAARLEHPNVVSIHEFGEVKDNYFIAMEYLPGEDLTAIIRHANKQDARIPIHVVGAIIQQSAEGLHYAHELKGRDGLPAHFIHRDVSPSNIVVTYHGVTKLLDFGIAKARNLDSTTKEGSFKGKLMHCAPEQLMEEEIDRRSDVFALGIIFWELLTGRPLFAASSDGAIMDAVRRRRVPKPSEVRPNISPDLDRIALKALTRRREDRFQSAQEFGAALDAYFTKVGMRSSQQEIGSWLASLFGEERAQLKKALSQGRDLDSADKVLNPSGSPQAPARPTSGLRSGWSTDIPSHAHLTPAGGSYRPTSVSELPAMHSGSHVITSELRLSTHTLDVPGGRATWGAAAVAVMALGGLAVWAMLPQSTITPSDVPAVVATAKGSLKVESKPPGAAIYIDGEPSGLLTPATIKGLEVGRQLNLRVSMVGYASKSQPITMARPDMLVELELSPSVGRVTIKGLRGRKLYIGGTLRDAREPLELSVGKHEMRVETSAGPEIERTIKIEAGTQTIELE